MNTTERSYIPALGQHAGLRLYDPLLRLIGGNRVRRLILRDAKLRDGQHVLDVGCGTGTLLEELVRGGAALELVGLDPDPEALALTAKKLGRLGASARLDRGFSDVLPYPDRTFDHVFSSFMFHHLGPEQQQRTLAEIRRVLKSDGTLHLLDFEANDVFSHGLLGLLHSTRGQRSGRQEGLDALALRAGFSQVSEVARSRVLIQPVVMHRCVK